jgi:hypothetical protein
MVLIKIALVAAAAAGLLAFAKTERWFEKAGLMSRCETTAAPYGTRLSGQWWLCREGAISGLPNLHRDHCESKGLIGNTETWYCPVPIARPS